MLILFQLYHLSIHYIEISTEHNTQNTLLECLCILLSRAKDLYRSALLEKSPRSVCLDERKGHRRNISKLYFHNNNNSFASSCIRT